jgi:hypothetical protein
MIFKLCLSDTWNGKTPNLLAALRGQDELYFQSLEIFQKTNSFYLTNRDRFQLFKSMSETVLLNIRRVAISIGLVDIDPITRLIRL